MKKIDVKEYLKNHAGDIVRAIGVSVLCGASFWLGCKYDNMRVARGLWTVGQADPEFDAHMMAAGKRMEEYMKNR